MALCAKCMRLAIVACSAAPHEKAASMALAFPQRPHGDDDELNTNPPTPCQIGKHPPALKPKIEPAGHHSGLMVVGVGRYVSTAKNPETAMGAAGAGA